MQDTPGSDIPFILAQLNRNRHFDGLDDVAMFRTMSAETASTAAGLLALSVAQLRQDVLVAAATGFKRGGYFVEFGATDGVYLSNTLLLERQFGWTGLLAEPARNWHEALRQNRSTAVDHRCVYTETGKQVMFREVASDQALSTIVDYVDTDLHHLSRRRGETYSVDTVSLNDLLAQHNCPRHIDFLSIDTEGSELAILEAFDFDASTFGLIACEHNYADSRNAILRLLRKAGYTRVMNKISHFDDWYVHQSCLDAFVATMPGWTEVSDQYETEVGAPMSEKERVIALLQQTVENLIVDRDAYKTAVEGRQGASGSVLEEQKHVIAILQQTVQDLIVDRDSHKAAALRRSSVFRRAKLTP